MAQKTPIILKDDETEHDVLADTDTITVNAIPISTDSTNIIRKNSDGLYAGVTPPPTLVSQYVDVENGDDDTGDGTQEKPLKTLAKAIANMIPQTRGYTIYLHDNQTHVLPSTTIEGVDFSITSYPSYQNQAELFSQIEQAWFTKYNALLDISTMDGLFDRATIIPDRVNPTSNDDPGGPYGYMTGLNSINGNVDFSIVSIECGKNDMDVPVSGMLRGAFLSDFDLPGPVAFNLNACKINCGSLPLIFQRGAGSNMTMNLFACLITGTSDEKGDPVFIQGWGSDAPKMSSMIGSEADGTNFVTVNGVDYHQLVTTGSIQYATDNTIGVIYHGDIPLNIDAVWLYKNS